MKNEHEALNALLGGDISLKTAKSVCDSLPDSLNLRQIETVAVIRLLRWVAVEIKARRGQVTARQESMSYDEQARVDAIRDKIKLELGSFPLPIEAMLAHIVGVLVDRIVALTVRVEKQEASASAW